MPISVSSMIAPKNSAKWPVLDDSYIRGGFRVVASVAARDAIYADSNAKLGLKIGMLILTADTAKLWRYSAVNTWTEYKASSLFTYTQSIADTTWLVNHNMGSTRLTFTVWSETGTWVQPDSCTIIDKDNLSLTFMAAQSGSATFAFDLS